MTEKLNKLLKNMDIPENLPISSDAILSGSAVWYLITQPEDTKDAEDTWLPNNIDIFCTKEASVRFRAFFREKKFGLADMRVIRENIIEEWVAPKNVTIDQSILLTKSFLENMARTYDIPIFDKDIIFSKNIGKTVKLIYPKFELVTYIGDQQYFTSPISMIKNKFDLPILENWYDGKEIFISYPEQVAERSCHVKTIAYNADKNLDIFSLAFKYEEYGLNIRIN